MQGQHKRLCIIILLCIQISYLYTQPEWLKEIVNNPRQIPLDEKAGVLVLRDVADIEINPSSKTVIHYQYAYQILNSDGESYGTINLPVSPHIKVKSIQGWVVNENGEYTKLQKENIIEINASETAAYYDDYRVLVASLPGVKPGIIAAFEAEVEDKDWTSLYQQYVFQQDQPVVFAKCAVTIPENWEFYKADWMMEGIEFTQTDNRYVWIAHNLPYQEREPLSPPLSYLSKRIAISCYDPDHRSDNFFRDWSDVSRWCARVYEKPAIPLDEMIRTSKDICSNAGSFDKIIQAIANFMQREIRYVAIEIGKERWEPRTADKTLFNRYGDCKDKTTLMRSLLQVHDIRSIPVLANTRMNVNEKLASPFQFNHCIIAIALPEKSRFRKSPEAVKYGWLFFDPTSSTVKLGELPPQLRGSQVLLGLDQDSSLVTLPWSESGIHNKIRRLRGEIKSDGSFTAQVTVIQKGDWAAYQKQLNREVSMQRQIERWRKQFSDVIPGLNIVDFKTTDQTDSVVMSFMITGDRLIRKVGNFIILHPDIFRKAMAAELNDPMRQQPIWFGQAQEVEADIRWSIPEQWKTSQDTFKIEGVCTGAALYLETNCSPGILSHYSRYSTSGMLMKAEENQKALEFSRQLSQLESHAVLFKLE